MNIPLSAEHSRLIRKLGSVSTITEADQQMLAALPLKTRSLEAGADVALEGETPTECCFVIEGLVCRYATTKSGGRQIVAFHIAGDLPDRDSLHQTRLDHTIGAVSACRVAFVSHADMRRLSERPTIAVALWRDAIVEGAVFRQWLTGLGRRPAKQRTAHLLCEMFARMEMLGLADDDHFAFPVTQSQLGDALGLSAVHVNRTLQELKLDGLISWRGSVVTMQDREAMQSLAEFDGAYLELKPLSQLG